jgi:hypothetical protein
MAIPPDIRNKGIFYKSALLYNFGRYYKSIPWQQAGVPISLSPLIFMAGALYKRSLSRFKRKLRDLGLPVYDSKLYFNVSEAMRNDRNGRQIEKILSDRNAIYRKYIPDDIRMPPKYMNAGIERICRILTFEIWMRQAADPSFRPHQLEADGCFGSGLI